jgi:hypothetical protein
MNPLTLNSSLPPTCVKKQHKFCGPIPLLDQDKLLSNFFFSLSLETSTTTQPSLFFFLTVAHHHHSQIHKLSPKSTCKWWLWLLRFSTSKYDVWILVISILSSPQSSQPKVKSHLKPHAISIPNLSCELQERGKIHSQTSLLIVSVPIAS